MLATVTHIVPHATLRRTRALSQPGRVIVRAGQRVVTTDVIAEAPGTSEHLMLDISRGLGLPADQADTFITRKIGEEVSKGDLLAGPVGLFHRSVRAPKDGRVVAAGSGQILLALDSEPAPLRAGLPGLVVDLIPERGAVIEATGAWVQCAWGNGAIDGGVLMVLAGSPDEPLTASKLDVSLRGAVLVAGPCSEAEALATAGQIPLRGLILSSLRADLLEQARKLALPVVLTEGFGMLPMSRAAYDLFRANDRADVAVHAAVPDRLRGIRPEVLIPDENREGLPLPAHEGPREIKPGLTVRLLRPVGGAAVGTVVTASLDPVDLPSGLFAPGAVVRLESGEQVTVPLANLDILERGKAA